MRRDADEQRIRAEREGVIDRGNDGDVAAVAKHGADRPARELAVEHRGDARRGVANDRVAGLGRRRSELAVSVNEVTRHVMNQTDTAAREKALPSSPSACMTNS